MQGNSGCPVIDENNIFRAQHLVSWTKEVSGGKLPLSSSWNMLKENNQAHTDTLPPNIYFPMLLTPGTSHQLPNLFSIKHAEQRKVQLPSSKEDPFTTQVTSALINFQARLSLAGHMPQTPGSCFLTSPVTLAVRVTCWYCKALLKQQPYRSALHKSTLFPPSKSAQLSCKSVFKWPDYSNSTVEESSSSNSHYIKKGTSNSKAPWRTVSVRGREPHLQFSSATVSSCKRRLWGHSTPACLPSVHVFPCTGQAAKQVQQAPLAAAGVPSLMPRLLKQRERGARHGKGSEGAGRELILEISRKEAKFLNALLAEIPSKWEETEPSSGTSLSTSGSNTHQPEGISCWPTGIKHTSDCERNCKQPGHDRLLLGCMYCFCSCPPLY